MQTKKPRNPQNFWKDKNGKWTPHKETAVMIFELLYPNFQSRRENVTEPMIREVTKRFNDLTGLNQRPDQLRWPLRLVFTKRRHEWKAQWQYDQNDEQYIKFKNSFRK